MNDLCEAGDEMTDQYYICNIHRGVLYHFVGNSMLIKINITCYEIIVKKPNGPIFGKKKEIFLGFQMGFPKFP